MTKLSCDVISKLQGKTLVTAESCTGGGIGAVLTAVPGCSAVFKGGIISYTNEVKTQLLRVNPQLLAEKGAVCGEVAEAMAVGARQALNADVAVSVTGLAGPSGDEYGNPVGTVYIGYSDQCRTTHAHCLFGGNRDEIRTQTIQAALQMIIREGK